MFFLFAASGYSWSERINVALTRYAMNVIDENYKNSGSKTLREQLKSIFIASRDYDLIDHPEQIGAWMSYVERSPFNFKAFNHWRFYSTAFCIDGSISEFPDNLDTDNMYQNFDNGFDRLYSYGSNTEGSLRTFPTSLLLKIVITNLLDGNVPLHAANMYSKEFPQSDRNGRDFIILYKGKNMSLYDLWETGCGLDSSVTAEFTQAFWKEIDDFGKTLIDPSNKTIIQFTSEAFFHDALAKSHNYAKSHVYDGIKQNTEVPDSYIQKCQQYSKGKIQDTYTQVLSFLNKIMLPKYKERTLPSEEDRYVSGPQGFYYNKDLDNSEKSDTSVFNMENDITESVTILLQTLFVILVPTTLLLIWKKHCGTY